MEKTHWPKPLNVTGSSKALCLIPRKSPQLANEDDLVYPMKAPIHSHRIHFWIWLISLYGVNVPRRLRADWRQQWQAESTSREMLLADCRKANENRSAALRHE